MKYFNGAKGKDKHKNGKIKRYATIVNELVEGMLRKFLKRCCGAMSATQMGRRNIVNKEKCLTFHFER